MTEHLQLKCSVCGYIPDDDDIAKTNYSINTCDTCGQQNVCDLCLHYSIMLDENNQTQLNNTRCPSCRAIGKNRKEILKDLY